MAEHIFIKCPNPGCNATLRLQRQPGMERLTIACPKCHTSAPFTSFKEVVMAPKPSEVTGRLIEVITGYPHRLAEGRNTVGRKSDTSNASIQLAVPGNRLSREHLTVDVTRKDGAYVYTATLCKQQVNPTSVNGAKMQFGVPVELRDGDLIALPSIQLRFKA